MDFNISHSIEVLSATPAALRSLIGNLSDEWTISYARPSGETDSPLPTSVSTEAAGTAPKREGEPWSPYDIIGHLIHGEQTDWIPRARIILEQGDNRTFVSFDRFAQFENSKRKSLGQLLDEFADLRTENIDKLRSWNLTGEQLDLEGVHPELGLVTLRQLLATWVVHDLNHIRQVVTVMAKRYSGEVGPWTEYLSILQDGRK